MQMPSEDGLNKKVGDEVVVKVGGTEKTLKVSGIYQDVTNGGKTAKAHTSLRVNEEAVLWYVVYMDVAAGVDKQEKMDYYQNAYDAAQVNDLKEFTGQTLGNIIDQMGIVVIGGIVIAFIIVVLITALFLRMLLSKDMSQIAIMRSIGLTSKQISHQYMAGTLTGTGFRNDCRCFGFYLFRGVSCQLLPCPRWELQKLNLFMYYGRLGCYVR